MGRKILDVLEELDAFVERVRKNLETNNGNIFLLTFNSIIRYYQFLLIIRDRYHTSSSQSIDALNDFFRMSGHMTGQVIHFQQKEYWDNRKLRIDL